MKRCFLISLCFIYVLKADAQATFHKTFGANPSESCYSLIENNDSSFVMAGTTQSFGAGSNDVYLIKTNKLGNVLWTKTFGGSGNDVGNFIAKNSDGGYLVTGYTNSFGVGDYDIYLIKTDSAGNLIWSKTIGGINEEHGNSCIQTAEGNFLIAGYTKSFGVGFIGAYLIKLSNNGDVLWKKIYNVAANYYDTFTSMQQTNDGGFILFGVSSTCGGCPPDMLVIKTDSSGSVLWSKKYGGTIYEYGHSIQQTADAGYVLAGTTNTLGVSNFDVYLVKTDSTGNVLWSKTYGGSASTEEGIWIEETSDNGFIITGSTLSFGAGGIDVYLIKTDSIGNLQWSKAFGSNNNDEGYSVKQAFDNGFAIAGKSQVNDYDFYLIKTDNAGQSGCNEVTPVTLVDTVATPVTNFTAILSFGGTDTISATITGNGGMETTLCIFTGNNDIDEMETSVSIYPNPSSKDILISNAGGKIKSIQIFDMMGRIVYENNINPKEIAISVSELNAGIYFVKIFNGEKYYNKKIIVEHD